MFLMLIMKNNNDKTTFELVKLSFSTSDWLFNKILKVKDDEAQ